MDTQTTNCDDKSLIINEISKEDLNSIIHHLSTLELHNDNINWGNLTNPSSIVLINDGNQVIHLKSGSQNKPLTLSLAVNTTEKIECYTTYSASRAQGKRSCVHRDTTINGVPQTVSVCMENQAFYDSVTNTNYFLECNPTQNYPNRALLYYAERYVSDSGAVKWRKIGLPILDEK